MPDRRHSTEIPPATDRSSTLIVAAVLLVAIVSFSFIGLRGLWEPDEGRYVAVASEMLRTGDWIRPELHHEHPHFTKPPLVYWLLALSINLFGASEWAVRLPGALAFAGTVACVGGLARRLVPGRSMTALLIYATATLPFVASNIVTTDTVLTACETLAMLGFVLAWTDLDKSESATAPNPRVVQFHRRWLLLMWAAFGLAFMTKGPPGLLPLAAMIGTVVATSGVRAVSGLFHPIGLGVFLLVGLPWYLYVVVDSPELGHYFITHEVIGRVTGEHHRNGEWYHSLTYLALLVGGMFPWSIDWFRPATMRRLAEARHGLGQDRVTLLLLLWVAVPLSVFMMVSSRMPLYILPLMAPLAIATARLKPAGWWSSNQGCRTIVTGAVILLAVRIGLGLAPIGRDARQWARSMPRPVPIVEVVFIDLQPRFGIGFYLGVEVEDVSLKERGTLQSLDAELDECEGNLLLIFSPDQEPAVSDALGRHDWQVISRSPVDLGIALWVAPPG